MTKSAQQPSIRNIEVSADAAGFPVVRWQESRGMAQAGAGLIDVECRIMKDSHDGTLLFVARGPVRRGEFEEGLPWERLRGFSVHGAEDIYYSRSEASRRHQLAGKGLAARWLWGDPGRVLVAEFQGGATIHVNCVDAAPMDLEPLQRTLEDLFVRRAEDLVAGLCREMFRWPVDDARVATYTAQRRSLQNIKDSDALLDIPLAGAVLSLLTIALLGTIGVVGFGLIRPWLP